MRIKINEIINRPFVRNVVVMATGTAAAQAITLLLSPIITRLYGPEAFGIMGTFKSIINILIPVAALTYPIAIVLPKSDQDALGLVRLSIIITAIMSTISIFILLLFQGKLVSIFNLEEIDNYLILIPLVILFGGLLQVAEQWLIRTKRFSLNARVTFFHSLITNGGMVGIGIFYPLASVLVILTAFGNGLKAFMMLKFAKITIKREKNKFNMVGNVKRLAKEYRDFPIFRAPEVLFSAMAYGFPVLMLNTFFGPASAGFYTIVMSVLSLPTLLIGKSVGDVFYPRIAEANSNKENITKLIKKATIILAVIGLLPYVVIFIFGPTLFGFVFGSGWEIAGEYARWISLYSFANFMNKPSIQAIPVINAQRFHLIYTIFRLAIRLGSLAIGFYVFSNDIAAVALYGITGAMLDIGLISITLNISKKYSRKIH